jgi:hypothetical protein
MDIKQLKKEYDTLLKNEDFDRLDLELKIPNIFKILKVSTTEIRHSNFLSWLLDPKDTHKLGDIFLKRFLREVFSSNRFEEVNPEDVEGMDFSKVEVRREWKNIDLLIILDKVIVCVENKVYSSESEHQLIDYKKVIQVEFPEPEWVQTFVFLTPKGIESINEKNSFEPISYEFIVESLERIISVYGESLIPKVKTYITDYITTIKREIMGTDELLDLSNKIYKNHKELIDFIYKNRPDNGIKVSQLMKEELEKRDWFLGSETKNYVRFLTPRIKDLIYINKEIENGWNKKESLLFEIELQPQTNKIIFKTVIPQTDKKYNVERLKSFMKDTKSGDKDKKTTSKNFFIYHKLEEKFIYEIEDQELRKSINDFYDKITPIVSKVENKLLEHSEELLRMKSV